MKLRRNRKKQSGYSILEIIFATAIVMTSIFAGFSSLRYLTRYNAAKRGYEMEIKYVLLVMQTVAANPSKFYVTDSFLGERGVDGEKIKINSLENPYWAYSDNYFGPASECPQCDNRIGVTVQPLQGTPRAAQATIRVMRGAKKKAKDPLSADSAPGLTATDEFKKVKDYTVLVTL